ncbi:unnamed protein product, partial [Musa hybrid cultivar]
GNGKLLQLKSSILPLQQNLAPHGEHFIHADPSCSRNHEPENEAANNQGSTTTSFSSEAFPLLIAPQPSSNRHPILLERERATAVVPGQRTTPSQRLASATLCCSSPSTTLLPVAPPLLPLNLNSNLPFSQRHK